MAILKSYNNNTIEEYTNRVIRIHDKHKGTYKRKYIIKKLGYKTDAFKELKRRNNARRKGQ